MCGSMEVCGGFQFSKLWGVSPSEKKQQYILYYVLYGASLVYEKPCPFLRCWPTPERWVHVPVLVY